MARLAARRRARVEHPHARLGAEQRRDALRRAAHGHGVTRVERGGGGDVDRPVEHDRRRHDRVVGGTRRLRLAVRPRRGRGRRARTRSAASAGSLPVSIRARATSAPYESNQSSAIQSGYERRSAASAAVSSGSAASRSAPLRATRRRIAFTSPAAPGRRASRTRSTEVGDGRMRRHAIGVEQLVRTEAQRVAHGRLEIGGLTAAERDEDVVERAAALDGAEGEPRGERAVARIELEAARLRGQRAVCPRAALLDAAEHAQRCEPGRHQPARVAGPSGPRRPRSSSPADIDRLPAGWISRSRGRRRRTRPAAARRCADTSPGAGLRGHRRGPPDHAALARQQQRGADVRRQRADAPVGVDAPAPCGSSLRSSAVSLCA